MSSLTLGKNLSSLRAQRLLGKSTDELLKSSERLSSGLRINHPSDDAAGLAVATTLNNDARIFSQGVRNLNDGVSALTIAEGALHELSAITTRQLELAEQAANGSYSLSQRGALNNEAKALTDEFNRIVATTTFNGINLLSTTQNVSLQAGAGANTSINLALGSGLTRTTGDGTFTPSTSINTVNGYTPYVYTTDVNGDGNSDLIVADYSNGGASGTNLDIFISNGDGTFKALVSYATGLAPKALDSADLNGDGYVDLVVTNYGAASFGVLLGNGNGTFKAQTTFITSANPTAIELVDVNGDGVTDVIGQDWAGGRFNVYIGNGNGTFQSRVSYVSTGGNAFQVGDYNEDGFVDVLSINQNLATVTLLRGNGNGTFKAGISTTVTGASLGDIKVADINTDGHLDFVVTSVTNSIINVGLGTGNGTFTVSSIQTVDGPRGVELIDTDGDAYLDVVTSDGTYISTYLGNGDGTFKQRITTLSGVNNAWFTASADFDNNGTIDLLAGSYAANPSVGILFGNSRRVGTATHVNLMSQTTARQAIDTLNSQLTRVTQELGSLGSYQSRIGFATRTLEVSRENYLAASSRIMDVDVAEETAQFIAKQISQQAAVAILAQANQQPQLALKLLS